MNTESTLQPTNAAVTWTCFETSCPNKSRIRLKFSAEMGQSERRSLLRSCYSQYLDRWRFIP